MKDTERSIPQMQYEKGKEIRELNEKLIEQGLDGKERRKTLYKLKKIKDSHIEKYQDLLHSSGEFYEDYNELRRLREELEESSEIEVIYKKMDSKQKSILANELKNKELERFTICKDIILKNPIKVPAKIRTDKQFLEWVQGKNLFKYMDVFAKWKLNQENWQETTKHEMEWEANIIDYKYECAIIPGNIAWIAKFDGIVRYYTCDNEKHIIKGINFFDLLDIIEISKSDECPKFYDALEYVVNTFNFDYEERRNVELQREKYIKNNDMLQHAEFNWKSKYPYLHKLTDSYNSILIYLNCWGMANIIMDKEATKDGQPVFFDSLSHIEKITKINKNTAGKAVNLFATLGFITKISKKDVPNIIWEMYRKSKFKKKYWFINVFTVAPVTDELLEEANEISKKLIAKGITNVSLISMEEVAKVIGKVKAKKIFSINFAEQHREKKDKDVQADLQYQEHTRIVEALEEVRTYQQAADKIRELEGIIVRIKLECQGDEEKYESFIEEVERCEDLINHIRDKFKIVECEDVDELEENIDDIFNS